MNSGASPRAGDLEALFQTALAELEAGRVARARDAFTRVVAAAPREPDPRRGLAEALAGCGDFEGAEREARTAVALDRRNPHPHLTLGTVLSAMGRAAHAERAFRAALALDRRFAPAALRLSALLRATGRTAEAAQATATVAASSREPVVLSAHADTLKALHRGEEALLLYRRCVQLAPGESAHEHNVASVLADLRRDEEALAATDRAFAKNGAAPETWLVRAHALQGLDRFEEAEAAYREAIRRRPGFVTAVGDLARLVWMRTGEISAAVAVLDTALVVAPTDHALYVEMAKLLDYAGDKRAAYEALTPALSAQPAATVHVVAAQIVAYWDPDVAARHAQTALAADPSDSRFQLALAEARLAQGRPQDAMSAVAAVIAAHPHDQHALAIRATSWRALGDERYARAFDYAALVQSFILDTPAGWPDLGAYLAELAEALRPRHGLKTHPVGQSLRQGTQTSGDLQRAREPAIRAFFQAIDAPIRAYAAGLGRGRDPVRSRNTGRWSLAGAWSVRLNPGGRHADHVHPEGWLSSAFYVDLPPAVDAGGREGWLKFGQPGTPHSPALAAQHWVKPQPGMLVLFPSYMWHGTEPFGGEAPRLTLAFDVVPA